MAAHDDRKLEDGVSVEKEDIEQNRERNRRLTVGRAKRQQEERINTWQCANCATKEVSVGARPYGWYDLSRRANPEIGMPHSKAIYCSLSCLLGDV